jgi:beta-N-acetylhexosaminidase
VTLACIFGLAGTTLSKAEESFFREASPWGFILFRRNVQAPDQVRRLTSDLRSCVGRADAPILIDQEGGRVQRLGPPHWRRYPAARAYGRATNHVLESRELARLGARLMAADLSALGINVDCAPVADLPVPGAHDIIGDRAYGETAEEVAVLARAAAEGLIAGGVLPVVKHIPGHGRARADSHEALPVVDDDLDTLDRTDFVPFRALSDMPLAMTAHILYPAVDRRRPATTSRIVVQQIIRQRLGFEGLLMSDDLSMKALSGDLAERARLAHAAGCDVALHCDGDFDAMGQVAAASRPLRGRAAQRAAAALARIPRAPEPFDEDAARSRLGALLEARAS